MMVPFEEELRRMPAVVVEAARGLPGSVVADRPVAGGFAMIEHVWHLADLETDAYEVRIPSADRLRSRASANFDAWQRAGVQEGVGKVTLRDIPRLMHEHDLSHRREIEALLQELAGRR